VLVTGIEEDDAGYKPPGICRWFLLCTNPATQHVAHPILSTVPACDRCAERATPKESHVRPN
jgi:hypothetical protein